MFSTMGGGPGALVLLQLGYALPYLTLAIVSGTLVDRWDRRRVMVTADLVRAAVVAALAAAVATGAASLPLVILAGVGLSAAGTFFGPARGAVLPHYVARELLVPANALFAIATQSATLIVPPVGGIAFEVLGPVTLLLADAVSFVWSAALLARLSPVAPISAAERRPLVEEAADGLRFIAGHPPSRLIVLIGAANQLATVGPYRVMVPAWVAVVLGGGAAEYGALLGSIAGGILVANAALALARGRLPLVMLIPAGILVTGVIYLFFAFTTSLVIACAAFFLMGIANGVVNASYSAQLQLSVPSAMRGRVFSTFGTAMQFTGPVSLVITGALATVVGPVALIAASAVALTAIGGTGLAAARSIRSAGGDEGLAGLGSG
ncbi:MAG TPA: MFS transporter [Candidatus Limnocylindria bacterium]|nr:MFS transporter [Candidatus Limnocylindria bacterium]